MAWINLAKIIELTEAEGPGLRTAIWVQGCLKRCKGCCNGQFLKILLYALAVDKSYIKLLRLEAVDTLNIRKKILAQQI